MLFSFYRSKLIFWGFGCGQIEKFIVQKEKAPLCDASPPVNSAY